MNKTSNQNRNFTIRQLWVVSKYLQRMMVLQRHSLMVILTNPSVKEILSANPKSLGHNQKGFFARWLIHTIQVTFIQPHSSHARKR